MWITRHHDSRSRKFLQHNHRPLLLKTLNNITVKISESYIMMSILLPDEVSTKIHILSTRTVFLLCILTIISRPSSSFWTRNSNAPPVTWKRFVQGSWRLLLPVSRSQLLELQYANVLVPLASEKYMSSTLSHAGSLSNKTLVKLAFSATRLRMPASTEKDITLIGARRTINKRSILCPIFTQQCCLNWWSNLWKCFTLGVRNERKAPSTLMRFPLKTHTFRCV